MAGLDVMIQLLVAGVQLDREPAYSAWFLGKTASKETRCRIRRRRSRRRGGGGGREAEGGPGGRRRGRGGRARHRKDHVRKG